MKRSINILIAFLLGIVALFGVAGCNGDTQNELQSKVNDLQSQIEELNDKLAEMGEEARERDAVIEGLNDRIAEMDEQACEQDATIEDLNEQIKNRDKRIEDLQKELRDIVSGEKELGPSYSLQRAYDYGFLTKEDLEQIAYYYHSREIEYPEPLGPEIATTIKEMEAAYWRNYKDHPIPEAKAEDFTIEKYLGVYSGYYVVAMDDIYTEYPAWVQHYWVGGVEFVYGNNYILVWKIEL